MRTRQSLEAENRELKARVDALEQGWQAERAELQKLRRGQRRRLEKMRKIDAAYEAMSPAEKADHYWQGRGL